MKNRIHSHRKIFCSVTKQQQNVQKCIAIFFCFDAIKNVILDRKNETRTRSTLNVDCICVSTLGFPKKLYFFSYFLKFPHKIIFF